MWKRLRQWFAPSSNAPEIDLPERHEPRVEPPLQPTNAATPDGEVPAVQAAAPAAETPPLEAPSLDLPLPGTPEATGVHTASAAPDSAQARHPVNTEDASIAPETRLPDAGSTLVHVFATRRDALPPDFLTLQMSHVPIHGTSDSEPLQMLMRYVQGGNPAEMGPLRVQLNRHLQRVHHMWRLEVAPDQLEAMGIWATQVNGVLALPDGSVRDPKGYALLPSPGAPEDELARIPHLPDAWLRKRRSEQWMLDRSLSPDVSLPPIASEDEIDLRSPQETAGRMLALLLVAARADMLSSPNAQELKPQALEEKLSQALPHLSPQEQAFVAQAQPASNLLQTMTWRYEAMHTLMWALGLIDDLPWPSQVCPVGRCINQLLQSRLDELIDAASLRPASELLDQLDLHQRLHALARESELNGRALPQLNRSVIMERHRALNWLIGHEHAPWDKVGTPS